MMSGAFRSAQMLDKDRGTTSIWHQLSRLPVRLDIHTRMPKGKLVRKAKKDIIHNPLAGNNSLCTDFPRMAELRGPFLCLLCVSGLFILHFLGPTTRHFRPHIFAPLTSPYIYYFSATLKAFKFGHIFHFSPYC
jgi:hypothetical protein